MSVEDDNVDDVTNVNEFPDNEEDTDPMLLALKDDGEGEADDDLSEAVNEPVETKVETETPKPDDKVEKPEPKADKAVEEEGDDTKPIMIPKARLDQVLAERDNYKNALGHVQAVNEVQTQMLQGKNVKEDVKESPDQPETKDYDVIITDAETKKVDLAQKYEDGEISLVEFETQRNELDRSIRNLDREQQKAMFEDVKKANDASSDAKVKQSNEATYINNEAINIQANHPYVAKIDGLPDGDRQDAWDFINSKATRALNQQGVNPNDGTLESKMAFIRAKAQLTDTYGSQLTGQSITPKQEPQGKAGLSETAQSRADKLDLADRQPPSIGNVGEVDRRELTEDDIINMTDDELADLYDKNPNLVDNVVKMKK